MRTSTEPADTLNTEGKNNQGRTVSKEIDLWIWDAQVSGIVMCSVAYCIEAGRTENAINALS